MPTDIRGFSPHYARQPVQDDDGAVREPNLNPRGTSGSWITPMGHARPDKFDGAILTCPPHYLPEGECPGAHPDTQAGGRTEGGYLAD